MHIIPSVKSQLLATKREVLRIFLLEQGRDLCGNRCLECAWGPKRAAIFQFHQLALASCHDNHQCVSRVLFMLIGALMASKNDSSEVPDMINYIEFVLHVVDQIT